MQDFEGVAAEDTLNPDLLAGDLVSLRDDPDVRQC